MKHTTNFFTFLVLFILSIMFLMIPVSAFDDSVQRYEDDYEEVWLASGSMSGNSIYTNEVINYPTEYSTAKAIKLYARNFGTGGASSYIQSLDNLSNDYIAFTMLDIYENAGSSNNLYYISVNGTIMSMTLPQTEGRYELIESEGFVSLYIDGVYIKNAVISEDGVIKIKLLCSAATSGAAPLMILDDFSTSTIIGMNEQWTQANTNIDTSYGIQSQSSFPTDEYTIKLIRPSISETVNTTSLGTGATGNESGFVRWNRNDVFGSNFGLYQAIIYRESDVLANTYFSIFDTTIQGSVDWEKDSYTIDETPAIGYSITNGDLSTYTYTLRVIDSLQQIKESYTLNSYSGIKGPNLAGYSTGTYYAILSRKHKNTDKVDDFAFDTVEISAEGINPSSYINFGLDQYTIGDTASYAFNWAEDDTSFWTRERIVIEKDGIILDRINAELSGTRYLDMDELGRYSISLISYGLLTYRNPVVHASDSVECIEPLDSFINVPQTTAIKENFTATYMYGTTPISPIINIKELQNDYTYKIIDTCILSSVLGSTTYTTNLSISSIGNYVIDLYDNGKGLSEATDTIQTNYVYIPPTDVVLSSYINTTSSVYAFGGVISGSYAIDDTNYTDYHTRVEVYNVDKDIISFAYEPLHQIDSFDIPISDFDVYSDGDTSYPVDTNFLSGDNRVQLSAYNADGNLNEVIAHKNITISVTDEEGYGLSLSKYTVEENEIFAIKAITPVQTSIVIHPLTLMGISDTTILINGTTQMTYALGIEDTYSISLVSGGETKATQIIKVLEGVEIIAPVEEEDDVSFDTNFESMLSSGSFIALLIIIACVGAFGKIGGVVGVFLGMVVGISISFLMGYLPPWVLFVMVLALCVVFVSKLINSFGGGE